LENCHHIQWEETRPDAVRLSIGIAGDGFVSKFGACPKIASSMAEKIGEMTMNHGILGVQMLRPPRFKQTCESLVVISFHHVSPTRTANLGNEEKESRSITETSTSEGFTQKLDNLSIPDPILCTILMLFSSDLGPLFSHHD